MIIPIMISLLDWAASLIIDFPSDNIPILVNESQWIEWGSALILCESFLKNDAPSPTLYDHSQEWMINVFYTMENNL